MQLVKAMEDAGILRLSNMIKLRHHGEGHQDYYLDLGDRELILRSGELEPFIAGVAYGMKICGQQVPEAITDVYRPDGPIRPGQVKANRAKKR